MLRLKNYSIKDNKKMNSIISIIMNFIKTLYNLPAEIQKIYRSIEKYKNQLP